MPSAHFASPSDGQTEPCLAMSLRSGLLSCRCCACFRAVASLLARRSQLHAADNVVRYLLNAREKLAPQRASGGREAKR